MAASITRRKLLASISCLAPAALLKGQSKRPIPVRTLNHLTLTVTDLKRSLEFYQGLFGLPIQGRQGSTVIALRLGPGPQCLVLAGGGASAKPGINHFCMTADNFNVDRITNALLEHGVTKADASGGRGGGMTGGPLKTRVRMRGPENGGAPGGTPELYVGDPDGITIQLQDPSYCGGAGALGEVCLAKPEPAPSKGLLSMRDLSHFTITVSDVQRSVEFYQDVFGMPMQTRQGATPVLGVGSGGQFLAFAPGAGPGRNGGPPRPANIGHGSFRMEGFNPDKVLKALAEYGIKARGDARGAAPPLVSYISMRMPDRHGAPDGTPELYFTDPDGILLQIQDVSYCGGAGKLGEVCP